MKPESRALLGELLSHHRNHVVREDGTSRPFNECLIGYSVLCTRAGVPHLYRYPGAFLQEIAIWCEANGYPPLNSLAINASEGHPGSHYDRAPGCNLLTWAAEAEATIRFRGYPGLDPGDLDAA